MQQAVGQDYAVDIASAIGGSGFKRPRAQASSLSKIPVSNSKRASGRATTPEGSSERAKQGKLEDYIGARRKGALDSSATTKSTAAVTKRSPPCTSMPSSSTSVPSASSSSSSISSGDNYVQATLRQHSGRAHRKDRQLVVVTFSVSHFCLYISKEGNLPTKNVQFLVTAFCKVFELLHFGFHSYRALMAQSSGSSRTN